MNLKDMIKKIRYEILDKCYNDLTIIFYDGLIIFKLYDGDVQIQYNGDLEAIEVLGLKDWEDSNGELRGTEFSTIKDIYKVMECIKDNHEILDELLVNKD